jgi:hypothetical protein
MSNKAKISSTESLGHSTRRFPMINKTTKLALSIALALGVFGSSLARANGDGDAQSLGRSFLVGPLGQTFGAQPTPTGSYAYGSAPPIQARHPARKPAPTGCGSKCWWHDGEW